ncbi:hypothetical protein ACM66B_003000 [Microbotryomycetes sp. NB124-2]
MADDSTARDGSQSPEDTTNPGKQPPGKRMVQSCAECKRRKIRCSRSLPCLQCINRGPEYAATCERPDGELPPTPSVTLVSRVATLESIVKAMQDRIDVLETGSGGNHSLQTHSSVERLAGDTSSAPSPAVAIAQLHRLAVAPPVSFARAERGQPEEEEVPLALEDFAMGFLANQARTTRSLHPDKANADLPQTLALPRTETFLLDRQVCWSLINIYFHRLEWYTKCLHTPTVLAEAEQVLAREAATQTTTTRASFLCILQLIQCIALHLLEPHEQAALHLDDQQCSVLALRLYTSAKSLLSASDWLRYPSLEWLQAVVLAGVYAYDSETEADVHWSLLGSAIKVAQNLGLSRLGAENEDKTWPPAWKSFKKREIGRRTWWNLVTLDWSHAQAHNGSYSVHPSQNHSVAPHNVNDSDLTADVFINRPMSQYTDSSMTRLKIDFVDTYRQLVDHLNVQQPPDYNWVIEMDNHICRLIEGFPHHFSDVANADPRNPTLVKECLTIRITAANRHLRLHRPYLTRGYVDERFAASRDRCVSSARAVLALIKISNQRCAELMRLWLVVYYGFVASVVCFVDLTRRPTDATRAALTDALAAFRHVKKSSAAARNAATLLEGLLAAEQEVRDEMMDAEADTNPAKKRRLSNSDGSSKSSHDVINNAFKRAVMRILSRATADCLQPATSAGVAAAPRASGSQPANGNGHYANLATRVTDAPAAQDGRVMSDGLELFFDTAVDYGVWLVD